MRIATTPPTATPHHTTSNPHKATRRALALFAGFLLVLAGCQPHRAIAFDGDRALALIEDQLRSGPRIPGTDASRQTAKWIEGSLQDLGWQTSVQSATYRGVELRNVMAMRGSPTNSPIILGTHYDTRPYADRDPVDPTSPVPGANDGASGVAVLLELARVLPADTEGPQVWLAFFDGEDSGKLEEWEWSAGASIFAAQMDVRPRAVMIVDMVGDSDLRLTRERTSDARLADEIWNLARDLDADAFVDQPGRAIVDDHKPFLAIGIPSVLIIDLEYPYWHTTADTLDKVSAESLEQVGSVLEAWILAQR